MNVWTVPSRGSWVVNEGANMAAWLSGMMKNLLERWRPVLQYADKLARAQERLGQSFECVCDPKPVDRRANSQIRIVDDYLPIHRNAARFAVPLNGHSNTSPSAVSRYCTQL